MKRPISILIFCLAIISAKAQEKSVTSVEKSIYGIQTGFLGLWIHNEARVSNALAFRSEIGQDATFLRNTVTNETRFAGLLTLSIEPRWYYNLNKRQKKSKRTEGNSGNFISIKVTYHPDFLNLTNIDNINFVNDISFVPTWGIRRNIGKHFNYESGIGIGYFKYLKEYYSSSSSNKKGGTTLNLHLRIGYRF